MERGDREVSERGATAGQLRNGTYHRHGYEQPHYGQGQHEPDGVLLHAQVQHSIGADQRRYLRTVARRREERSDALGKGAVLSVCDVLVQLPAPRPRSLPWRAIFSAWVADEETRLVAAADGLPQNEVDDAHDPHSDIHD